MAYRLLFIVDMARTDAKRPFELCAFPLTNRPRTPANLRLGILRGHCYALEGLIGAGKTSLLELLEAYLTAHGIPCLVFREEVPDELLKPFQLRHEELKLLNRARDSDDADVYNEHTFVLQREMLRRRIDIYKRACEAAEKTGAVVFLDRSIWGDMMFAAMHRDKGRMSAAEADQYAAALETFRTSGENLDLTAILYLQCTPQQALERVRLRTRLAGGGSESEYDLPYMIALEAMHEKILGAHEAADYVRTPVLRLDGRDRNLADRAETDVWVGEIMLALASGLWIRANNDCK